jgi:hypothetical protein
VLIAPVEAPVRVPDEPETADRMALGCVERQFQSSSGTPLVGHLNASCTSEPRLSVRADRVYNQERDGPTDHWHGLH